MDYDFEQFTEFKGKFTPIISLGKSGGFGFSTGFMERYRLKDHHYIKIFYDKNKNAVAFSFCKEKTESAVKFKNRGTNGFFSSRSFLGKYAIDKMKYQGRYTPKLVNDEQSGKLYVIELKSKEDNRVDKNNTV